MLIEELEERSDYMCILKNIISPTLEFFDDEKSGVLLPNYYATSYSDSVLELESFSRILWGAIYFDSTVVDEHCIIRMICNGVNPEAKCYWGTIENYSQKIVETFPILFYLIKKKKLVDQLSQEEKKNIENWFYQVNNVQVSENNWEFFLVLDNIALKKLGMQYSKEVIENAWKKIEKMYIGNGWYSDGLTAQIDYYISFAMHFYSLIYYTFCENCKRREEIKERAKLFSKSFISWFDENGSALPIGRSLTYKFAQVAFWSALVYSGIDKKNNGIYKGIINRNIRWWLEKNIFLRDGLLSIGYAYENQAFSEYYNGAGSSYWCLKAFLFLMLPDDDDFFKIKEEKLPLLLHTYHIPEAKMTVCRYEGVPYAFVNGQKSVNCFGHTECKYEKFVYSTLFGFCISKSYLTLELLSADSNLAISFNENDFFARHACKNYINKNGVQVSTWVPQEGVSIESIIIPDAPSHLRIHLVKTNRRIVLIDHGFSVESTNSVRECKEGVAKIRNSKQVSSIKSIIGNGEPIIVEAVPNTNIIYGRVSIPALRWELKAGNYAICNEIVGRKGDEVVNSDMRDRIKIDGKTIKIDNYEFDIGNCKNEPYVITGCLKKIKKVIKRIKNSI